MIHLNGNILCVIDCETTGLDPLMHSIWQFTCLPLDFRLDPHSEIGVFDVQLQPTTEHYDSKALSRSKFAEAMTQGLAAEVGANLFHEWFERLPLGFKKRIMVLAHNWPFDREFIRNWLGDASFDYYFDPRYRDTMALAAALNDVCDVHANRVPFNKHTLRGIANILEVEWDDLSAHNSLYDANKTAQVYKKLVHTAEFIWE